MSFDIDDLKNRVVYYGPFEVLKAGWGIEGSKRGVSVQTPDGPRRVEVREVVWASLDRVPSLNFAMQHASEAMAVLAGVDLRTVWELLLEEGDSSWTLEDLAGLAGVGSGASAIDGIALALEGPNTCFKRKGDRWVPWSRKQVEERDLQKQRTEQRKQALGNVTDEVRAVAEKRTPLQAASKECRSLIAAIEQVALQPDIVHAQGQRALMALYPGDSRPASHQAFELLVALGLFGPHEDLNLRRLNASTFFPDGVEQEIPGIRERTAAAVATRPDVSHLMAVAIDDPDTTEVDDALALEIAPDGYVVHVLIADPSAAVIPGSATDLEAQRRASTIYHPIGRFPMMPHPVSSDALTLTSHSVRPAFDHVLRFDPSFRLVGGEMRRVALRLAARLSYEEVDALLCGAESPHAPALRQLWQIGQRLMQNRIGAGAVLLNPPEYRLKVVDDKVVQVKKNLADTPSHRLVAEFMVAAGVQLADYCVTHHLPAVYRTQPRPEEDLGFTLEKASDPAYIYATVRKLKKGEATTHPGSHAGLGLSVYCQATSPLRRYMDMALQRQVGTHLEQGRAFYSNDEMVRLLGSVEPTSQLARKAGDEGQRYWMLVDLKEKALGQNVEAEVVALDKGQVAVQLVDWGLSGRMHAYLSTAPGQRIQLKVNHVDPRLDILSLRPA